MQMYTRSILLLYHICTKIRVQKKVNGLQACILNIRSRMSKFYRHYGNNIGRPKPFIIVGYIE